MKNLLLRFIVVTVLSLILFTLVDIVFTIDLGVIIAWGINIVLSILVGIFSTFIDIDKL